MGTVLRRTSLGSYTNCPGLFNPCFRHRMRNICLGYHQNLALKLMKRLLLLLLLLPLGVRAGEIVLPKFDVDHSFTGGGSLTNEQSEELTKFLEDGLKAAKEAGNQKLIEVYEETLEIHYDDPLNPNPLAERDDSLSTYMQEYYGDGIGLQRIKISECKIQSWEVKTGYKPVTKTATAMALTKKLTTFLTGKLLVKTHQLPFTVRAQTAELF